MRREAAYHQGARQVGKTWLMKEFGRSFYKNFAYFKKYIREKTPECAVRFSERGYMKNGEITNIPLYLAPRTSEFL